MPRDEAYAREKLERFFPVFHGAVVRGVRASLDQYAKTAHLHRPMTRRNIARDHIVDNLRADLMLDAQVSIKDRNQTTYLELCGEFRVLAKMADDAGHVRLNANQVSWSFQFQGQSDIFASEDLPEATNLYLSYVPNSQSPRDPFVYLICPKPGGHHWMLQIEPPAIEIAGEIGGRTPEPAGVGDGIVRIPERPKTDEESET